MLDVESSYLAYNYKEIDNQYSAHDTFLEYPSSGTLIVKRLEGR